MNFTKKDLYYFIGLVAIVLIMYFQPFRIVIVKGSSMEPTLNKNQILIMKRSKEVKKEDVVVISPPESWTRDSSVFIKRVVAVAGDRVEVNSTGFFVNGKLVKKMGKIKTQSKNYELKPGEIFVLGDNFPRSSDSLSHWINGNKDFVVRISSVKLSSDIPKVEVEK